MLPCGPVSLRAVRGSNEEPEIGTVEGETMMHADMQGTTSDPTRGQAGDPQERLARFGRPLAGALLGVVVLDLAIRLLQVLLAAALSSVSPAVNWLIPVLSIAAALPTVIACAMVIVLSHGTRRLSGLGTVALLLVVLDHLAGIVLGNMSSVIIMQGVYGLGGTIRGIIGVAHLLLFLGLIAVAVLALVRPALLAPRIPVPLSARVIAITLLALTVLQGVLTLIRAIAWRGIPMDPGSAAVAGLLDVLAFSIMPLILVTATALAAVGVRPVAGAAAAVVLLSCGRDALIGVLSFLSFQLIASDALHLLNHLLSGILLLGMVVAAALALIVELRRSRSVAHGSAAPGSVAPGRD